MKRLIKVALPLAIAVLFLFEQALSSHYGIIREFQAAVLSLQWLLLLCIAVWCGTFLFLTFSPRDWPLLGLLLSAIVAFFIGAAASSRAVDALILLAGVTLGCAARFFVGDEVTSLTSKPGSQKSGNQLETPHVVSCFLFGLVLLLAFSSWWHLEVAHSFYPGTRWTGLWDNPNIYGMLMATGGVLAIGLLIQARSGECGMRNEQKQKARTVLNSALHTPHSAILLVALGMMGLFFSYSRGAWAGTVVGLLYLAKAHGKLKWRWVLPGILVVAAVVCVFWHSTADTDQWYLKRLDFSRPSAQHRVSAWRGALQMMRDHPLGVGWNQAVSTYEKNYSPPKDGAAALTMNSYFMLGTELGLPGLLAFIAYIYLKFKPMAGDLLPVALRAGTLVLLVAFWFDGGLFDLPTAATFWILLELGAVRRRMVEPPSSLGLEQFSR